MVVLERAVVPLSKLKPAPYNPRRIDAAALAALERSISEFDQVQELVVNRRNMRVVGGHQRIRALKNLKRKDAAVVFVDLDDVAEKALNIALNSALLAGEFDAEKLQLLLTEIEADRQDLLFGLRLDELRGDLLAPKIGFGDPDDAPEPDPEHVITALGDVWQLGEHRLICGDSSDPATIAAVCAGDRIDQLATDPPFGVDYAEKQRNINDLHVRSGQAQNVVRPTFAYDVIGGNYRPFFGGILRSIPFAEYASIYIFCSSHQLKDLYLAFEDVKFFPSDVLVWDKGHLMVTRKDYNAQVEFLLYGWPDKHRFYGPTNRSTVLAYAKVRKGDVHPTMRPVTLMEQIITDGSPGGGVILDCFGGSGTTLIAAELHGRRARLVEIDPVYCDVIVKRYREFTGDEPEHVLAGDVESAAV